VGGNLVRALLKDGRKVRVLIREDSRAIEGLDVEVHKGNIFDPQSLASLFDGCESVFHLAAMISITGDRDGRVHKTNVEGVNNVVNACLESGVKRLVHFSSIHAMSPDPEEEPICEQRDLTGENALIAYDRSKAMGEREIQAGVKKGLDAVTVNPTAVIGPNDFKPSRVGEVIIMLCNRTMPALVDGGFNWVDVRDVVQGALCAEKKGKTGERYLLSGTWAHIRDFASIVEEISGIRKPVMCTPMWLAHIGAPFVGAYCKLAGKRPLYTHESLKTLCHHRHITNEKARNELGYNPRPLKETISDTIDWFREHDMIKN